MKWFHSKTSFLPTLQHGPWRKNVITYILNTSSCSTTLNEPNLVPKVIETRFIARSATKTLSWLLIHSSVRSPRFRWAMTPLLNAKQATTEFPYLLAHLPLACALWKTGVISPPKVLYFLKFSQWTNLLMLKTRQVLAVESLKASVCKKSSKIVRAQ